MGAGMRGWAVNKGMERGGKVGDEEGWLIRG